MGVYGAEEHGTGAADVLSTTYLGCDKRVPLSGTVAQCSQPRK